MLDDEEAIRVAADGRFAANPIPRPEDEAERASFDIPADCHMERSETPSKKHEKNVFILSMAHVCQTWRTQLIGLKSIWSEIAFDIETSPASVRLATLFLTKIENDNTPLNIYAGFAFGDHPHPALASLLPKLQARTQRWERFLCWGRLEPYLSYLDHPAPKLQTFSDNHDLSTLYSTQTAQLFAGDTPILRSLVTSALGNWQPTTLTRLKTLNVWDCGANISIRSLLNVLRCTPVLEEIIITSPNPPLEDCLLDEVVDLLHLRDLQVRNPDFYSIIEHLVIPNVQTVTVYSVHNRGPSGIHLGPVFQTSHLFVGFLSMRHPLPMFSQAVAVASFDVQSTYGSKFVISFVTEEKRSLCVSLEWVGGGGIDGWREYVERSISALAEMRFSPGATLKAKTEGYIARRTDYSPLLRLNAIECFAIEGPGFWRALEVLGCRQPSLFPGIRFLFAPEVELDAKSIESIYSVLQFRRDLVMAFDTDYHRDLVRMLGEYCTIEGEFALSEMTCGKLRHSSTEHRARVNGLEDIPWSWAHVRLKG